MCEEPLPETSFKKSDFHCGQKKQEASLIAKDINVDDPFLWISQAQKSVSEETVQKCFARCGFKSDPEMDYAVAEVVATDPELTSVVEMATTALSLDNPMTADEYVTWDEDTPSREELGDNWEEELLLRHKTPDTATTTAIESDEETEISNRYYASRHTQRHWTSSHSVNCSDWRRTCQKNFCKL